MIGFFRHPAGHRDAALRHLRAGLGVAIVAIFAAGALPARAGDPPAVSVSVLPIHSLVAGVMAGLATPGLLVEAGASPHGFALRPSQMAAIGDAALIVRVGEALDGFLDRAIRAQAGDARVLTLTALPTITLRRWTAAEPHDHGQTGDGPFDPHIWLDPANARVIVAAVADELARLDPAHAALYDTNATVLEARLASLDAELRSLLAPLGNRSFVVFHDAYGYLQDRYGLTGALAVTLDPERMPGARRISELRETIAANGISCVFAEPQFPDALVAPLIEGTGARAVHLDPLGAEIAPGPEAYFAVMRAMAEALASCLSD